MVCGTSRRRFNILPTKVLWIEAQDGGRWGQYACRTHRMAQSGVIAGRFQLGIRVDATDNRLQARSCTWRVDQVPKTWSFGEVQDLLENYAFHRNPGSRQGMAPPLHILARLYPQSDGLIQPVVAIPDGTHIELSTTTRRPEDANCKKSHKTPVSPPRPRRSLDTCPNVPRPNGSTNLQMNSQKTKRWKPNS